MLKNPLICYDTCASACSQGLDIQLIVLLTSETSDPSVTHNPTKGNIIGCHLIRINVKAPVRWTRPWNFTVQCKMWFPWKTHLRCENGAETAPDGSAKSTWMFQWICFHWARTKKKNNNRRAKGKIGCPALKHEHASRVTVIAQKHHPGWRDTRVPLAQLALCVSVRADKPDVHLWAARVWIFQSAVVSCRHSLLRCASLDVPRWHGRSLGRFKSFRSSVQWLAEVVMDCLTTKKSFAHHDQCPKGNKSSCLLKMMSQINSK